MPHIETHLTKLENGLRVVVCPIPSSPVVNVTVMYDVGSHDERHERTGLAHLFEHLMFDNASPDDPKQYDVNCLRSGGTNNAYTTFDYTTYHIDLPSHQAEIGFWLESERMRTFRITDEALATQRSVVVEEINQNVFNQPYGQWRKAQQAAAFTPESSYSWDVYGSAEHVSEVSIEDARGFFNAYYQPANAVLCVSGGISVDRAQELAQKHFGSITRGAGVESRNIFSQEMCQSGAPVVLEDQVPLHATYVALHIPGYVHSDLLDAEIAATIIGSGRSSILYQTLVHSERIASAVGAFVDRREHASLLTIYAHAASPEISAAFLTTRIHEILASYTVTEEEVSAATNKLRTSHAIELQRSSGISDSVAWSTLFRGDPNFVNKILDRYASVTIADVQKIIRHLSDPQQTVVVQVVPENGSDAS